MPRLGLCALIATVAVASMSGCVGPGTERSEVMVYAAVSLRDALQRTAPICEAAAGVRLSFDFGASDDLARRIVMAGRADAFFAADEASMDQVADRGLIDGASRRSVLSNRLVVVAPIDGAARTAAAGPAAMAAWLAGPDVRRLSLADPEIAPLGRYARAWLERIGLWATVRHRVVPAIDARAALSAVESGAAQAGIVYRTDAARSTRVRILHEVGGDEAPAISYPLAALRGRPNADQARRVVECLAGPEAAEIFREEGFIVGPAAP